MCFLIFGQVFFMNKDELTKYKMTFLYLFKVCWHLGRRINIGPVWLVQFIHFGPFDVGTSPYLILCPLSKALRMTRLLRSTLQVQ